MARVPSSVCEISVGGRDAGDYKADPVTGFCGSTLHLADRFNALSNQHGKRVVGFFRPFARSACEETVRRLKTEHKRTVTLKDLTLSLSPNGRKKKVVKPRSKRR